MEPNNKKEDRAKRHAEALRRLLGEDQYCRIRVEGYMPLVVERLTGFESMEVVLLAHWGEQNGDVMRDPEVMFVLEDGTAEPVEFRNDYLGVHHDLEEVEDPRRREALRASIASFCDTWFANLEAQGFFAAK